MVAVPRLLELAGSLSGRADLLFQEPKLAVALPQDPCFARERRTDARRLLEPERPRLPVVRARREREHGAHWRKEVLLLDRGLAPIAEGHARPWAPGR